MKHNSWYKGFLLRCRPQITNVYSQILIELQKRMLYDSHNLSKIEPIAGHELFTMSYQAIDFLQGFKNFKAILYNNDFIQVKS